MHAHTHVQTRTHAQETKCDSLLHQLDRTLSTKRVTATKGDWQRHGAHAHPTLNLGCNAVHTRSAVAVAVAVTVVAVTFAIWAVLDGDGVTTADTWRRSGRGHG